MDGTELLISGTLDCGLRYAVCQSPGHTECCGVTFNSGSRDEDTPQMHGIAHFVEHTVFKGTPRRRASYILNRMEAVGGELNAFTTKEETTVYSLMPAGNFRRASSLIAELVAESVFPQRGIDLEREVICDEIDSYLDSPADAAFDFFDEMMYEGNSLAHNILGTKETVMAINSEQCRTYIRQRFAASNGVLFYLGPSSPKTVLNHAQKVFKQLPSAAQMPRRVAPQVCPPVTRDLERGLHQCHTVMGVPIGGLGSPERHVYSLAINIVGGPGMNSLLNMALRERRGLVYSVDASSTLYSDCGMMNIYFGCDHADLKRCRATVMRTLEGFASSAMAERTLESRKRQYLGQLTLGRDNREQRAISLGRASLHGLPHLTVTELHERIMSIGAEQLRACAERLAQAPERTLTLF